MCGSETKGWKTTVDVAEEVVVVCDFELASVFTSVTVGVADQGAFPLALS